MSVNPEDQPAFTPLTPPTMASPLSPPPRAQNWPTVIGIIAIVFGVLAVLAGIWACVFPLFVDKLTAAMPGPQRAVMQVTQEWRGWTIASGAIAALLAALLLVGGAGLAARRAWARPVCFTWAGLKMAFAVVQAAIGYEIQQQTFTAMKNDPSMAAVPMGLTEGAALAGVVLGCLWGWALPVFTVVWFTRPTIKAQIAEWGPTPVMR